MSQGRVTRRQFLETGCTLAVGATVVPMVRPLRAFG